MSEPVIGREEARALYKEIAQLRRQLRALARSASGYITLSEISDPGVSEADTARIYADDSGGTTRVMARFSSGSAVDLSASGGGGAHAVDHKSGGSDEVDGDQIDIDWNPSNSTPATTPTEVSSVDHLTAHLYGIDQALAGKAATSHTHVEADITDLGSYAVTGHTHTESDITDLQAYALDSALTAHLTDTVDAHDASAISILDTAADFTATDVEGALAELQTDHEADDAALTTHIGDATAAHAGSAISNVAAGNIVATDVQAAINELDTEKAAASHTHTESDITDLQSYIVSGSAAGGDLGGTYPNPTVDDDGHNHTLSTITDAGTAAAKNIPATGDASATEVVYGTDTRLTDARTATAHTHVEADITDLQAYALDSDLTAHVGDATAAHAASAISADSTTLVGVGTDVQAVFEELDNAIVAAELVSTNHLADATDAHDASAISNVAAGNIVATDVQAAINELDTEKAAASHTHVEADITDLGSYAVTGHTHTASEVTDFSTAADARIAAASLGDLADTTFTSLTSGDVATWNGSAWINQAAGAPGAHASSHIDGGSDAIDGDKLEISWTPSNSTPATTPTEVDTTDDLTAHLYGIDQAIGGKAATSHTHTESDITDLQAYALDSALTAHLNDTVAAHAGTAISNTPAGNIAATTVQAAINELDTEKAATSHTHVEADITDLGSYATTTHAADHKSGGSDEIDGDQLDIDWNPSNYTPATTPTESTSVDHLTSHLYGIDQAIGLKVYTGSVTWTAGTGTQAVTGAGFTPKGIICFGTGFANSASVMTFGLGMSDGTTSVGIGGRADSSDGNRSRSATSMIRYHGSNSSTASDEATLSSFDSDGFTFNKTVNANNPLMYFMLFG